MDWKELQVAVAELFKSVGCAAEIEKKVKGARGEHSIDVYVQFEMLCLICIWANECKHCSSNIPKEKVLAVQSIVQDIGADKGVLISSKGFQSGAIRCTQKSNITLTNFEDLRGYIDDQIRYGAWEALTRRVQYLSMKLFYNQAGKLNLGDFGHVAIIDLKIKEALFGSGRMVLIRSLNEKPGDEVFIKYEEPAEFIKHANQLLDEIEKRNDIA